MGAVVSLTEDERAKVQSGGTLPTNTRLGGLSQSRAGSALLGELWLNSPWGYIEELHMWAHPHLFNQTPHSR